MTATTGLLKSETPLEPAVPPAWPSEPPAAERVFAYEYSVIRYQHDPSTGESLNIGVALYSRDAGFLQARLQSRYSRLSAAFPGFDAELYQKIVRRFEKSIEVWSEHLAKMVAPDTLPLLDLPENLEAILGSIWEDKGMSYQFAAPLPGVSDDVEEALDSLFYRLVLSQQEQSRRVRREDQDVWTGTYRDALRREHVVEHLVEHTFKINEFEYRFDYTFQNGTCHALKPVTLDYAEKSGMRDRVDRVLGEAKALSTSHALGMLYILLGKPTNSEHLSAYHYARDLLDTIDIDHRIVEEEDADEFSRELAMRMRSYGLIP